jgi:hypothetical protein
MWVGHQTADIVGNMLWQTGQFSRFTFWRLQDFRFNNQNFDRIGLVLPVCVCFKLVLFNFGAVVSDEGVST